MLNQIPSPTNKQCKDLLFLCNKFLRKDKNMKFRWSGLFVVCRNQTMHWFEICALIAEELDTNAFELWYWQKEHPIDYLISAAEEADDEEE